MSAHDNPDRKSFQEFLANAFAVQECGLDRVSLSTLAEMQQLLIRGEFDIDGAMSMIADRALKVSTASGIAIALLEGNELVYRAGSGTATEDVGRHVPAVLGASSGSELRREILRVENAQDDSRIQGEICRQFKSKALLILPIYRSNILVGVLQVLFSEAHTFLDSELRMYRMVLGLLEEALVPRVQDEQKFQMANAVTEIASHSSASRYIQAVDSTKISAVRRDVPQQNLSSEQGLTSSHDRPMRRFDALWIRVTALIHQELTPRRTKTFWRIGAVVTVSIVLAANTWLAFRDYSARSALLRTVSSRDETGQHTPTTPSAMINDANLASHRTSEAAHSGRGFRRARIGPNEVDYIADDVTIRNFTTASAGQMNRPRERHVNFGDDVTVRYFSYPPITTVPRSH